MFNSQPNRYEQSMMSSSEVSKDLRIALAGSARAVRLSREYSNTHEQMIWNTGADIIGPSFLFFTWWVLESAKKLNINQLYFLSRDAHIFLQIANLINAQKSHGIDCRYLYGSRHLWSLSSLKEIRKEELGWILSDWWYSLSVNSVCARMGIGPKDIAQHLVNYGFEERMWGNVIDGQSRERLSRCLLDKAVQKKIIALLSPQFEQTVSYLKQEGFGEFEDIGIVDIGWKGKPQVALNRILRRGDILSKNGVTGFYFGVTETKEICPGDRMFSFLFDLSKSLNHFQLRNNHIYEAFASSDQGKIITFKQLNGRYVPHLEDSLGQPAIDWGVRLQQESILAFVSEFISQYPLHLLDIGEARALLKKPLNLFINHPTLDEATAYGCFPMDGEQTESSVAEIAPMVGRKRFWQLCFDLKKFNLFWVQASLVRSHLECERMIWRLFLPLLEFSYYLLMIISNFLKRTER